MYSENKNIGPFIEEAICHAIYSVAEGSAQSVRLRFSQDGSVLFNDCFWLLIDLHRPSDGSSAYIFVQTNDLDLMVGTPPSYHCRSSLGELEDACRNTIAFCQEKLLPTSDCRLLIQVCMPESEGARTLNLHASSEEGYQRARELVTPDCL